MSRTPPIKPLWEMNTEELREATKEFDEEFVAGKAKPLSPQMRSRWARAKAKTGKTANGVDLQTIAVRLDKVLVEQCTALAKKKRISRDALIARSLKATLQADAKD